MKCLKLTNYKHYYNGSSFPEQALVYYLKSIISPSLNLEVRPRDRITLGAEFDALIEIDREKRNYILLIEYDGSGWHQNLKKDLDKNNIAVEKGHRLARIREKGCPEMKDDRIFVIEREQYKRSYPDMNKYVKRALDWIISCLKEDKVLSNKEFADLYRVVKDLKNNVDIRRDKSDIIESMENEYYKQKQREFEENKEKLLELAKEHLDYFFISTEWDQYVDENNLYYKTYDYVFYFGRWSNAVECAWGKSSEEVKKYKMIQQGFETIDHLKSFNYYKKYLQELQRDSYWSATAIVDTFGTWNNFKKALDIDLYEYTPEYSKEFLIQNAIEHIKLFKRSSVYDEYAKKHGLPGQHAYRHAFGSMDEAKRLIGIPSEKRNTHNRWSTEKLIKIAKENIKHFTTMDNWMAFGKKINKKVGKINIPYPSIYQKRFNGWRNAKLKILEEDCN